MVAVAALRLDVSKNPLQFPLGSSRGRDVVSHLGIEREDRGVPYWASRGLGDTFRSGAAPLNPSGWTFRPLKRRLPPE